MSIQGLAAPVHDKGRCVDFEAVRLAQGVICDKNVVTLRLRRDLVALEQ